MLHFRHLVRELKRIIQKDWLLATWLLATILARLFEIN